MSATCDQIVATILGCGSSGGVPRIGNDWGLCDPNNRRNRRRRCSLLIEGRSSGGDGVTRVLIDTGCDLREQLLDAGTDHVDAVLYTHEHADHTHGIDDLRVLAINSRQRVDVYFSPETGVRLLEAFGYCFASPPGSPYPPILTAHEIAAGDLLSIDGAGGRLDISCFRQEHGDIYSLGFKIGKVVYSCDVSDFAPEVQPLLSDLDVWIIDALKRTPHPSHLSYSDALNWIERMQPREAVLTDMHIDLDYETVKAETPENVVPAHDGLRIDVIAGRVLSD